MTTLAAAMPHIVDQVDRGKAGWNTKADLMMIVAWRTSLPGSWTEINRAVLVEEYHRSSSEAEWALHVLEELAVKDRVLRMRKGKPITWRLSGEDLNSILGWLHVPWVGGRKRALASIRARVAEAAVGPGAVPAGQPADPGAADTRFGHLGDLDLSVIAQLLARQQQLLARQLSEPEPAPAAPGPTPPSTPSPLSGLLRNPLSLGSEGEHLMTEIAKRIKAYTGCTLQPGSKPWTAAAAIAGRNAQCPTDLLRHLETLASWRNFEAILDDLERWTPTPVDHGARLASLTRQLAQYEALDAEPPEALVREIALLQGSSS